MKEEEQWVSNGATLKTLQLENDEELSLFRGLKGQMVLPQDNVLLLWMARGISYRKGECRSSKESPDEPFHPGS